MPTKSASAAFTGKIRQPKASAEAKSWSFTTVPPAISKSHLRRGRIMAQISVGDATFSAQMEPDGQLGHWFKIPADVMKSEKLRAGEKVDFALSTLPTQPDPSLPPSFSKLLKSSEAARSTWEQTTTLAKIDWVHWLESAKQAETKRKRELDAIDMLAHGKKRVCCFDPSGFYSKALSRPEEAIS
jgi:hypothetical protein